MTGSDRRIIGRFKNRGPFVDLIEHCDVDHVGSLSNGPYELLPVKSSFVSGNGCFITFRMHIMPAETRENYRNIIQIILIAPLYIFFNPVLKFRITALIKSSHEPGSNN